MTNLPFTLARNVTGDAEALAAAQLPSNARLVEDWDGAPLGLFESEWSLRLAAEWNPKLTFEPFGVRGLSAAVAS
jgi:peptide subunit release factor RF-3